MYYSELVHVHTMYFFTGFMSIRGDDYMFGKRESNVDTGVPFKGYVNCLFIFGTRTKYLDVLYVRRGLLPVDIMMSGKDPVGFPITTSLEEGHLYLNSSREQCVK